MDITIVRGLLIFGCGAAVGAAIANKVLKKKYEIILEEELKEVREWRKSGRKNITEEDEVNTVVVEGDGYRLNKHGFTSDAFSIKKKDLEDSIFIPEQSPPDDDPDEEEVQRIYEAASREYSGTTMKMYVIPLDSFVDEMIGYDKITLGYYAEDDVLVDDNEDIIDDVDYVIGHAALERFGDGSEDDDIVYVRNERTGADYEVIRHHKSYQTEVLGFIDPPNNRRGY